MNSFHVIRNYRQKYYSVFGCRIMGGRQSNSSISLQIIVLHIISVQRMMFGSRKKEGGSNKTSGVLRYDPFDGKFGLFYNFCTQDYNNTFVYGSFQVGNYLDSSSQRFLTLLLRRHRYHDDPSSLILPHLMVLESRVCGVTRRTFR